MATTLPPVTPPSAAALALDSDTIRPVLPYKPSNPPLEFRDWPRWIDDELNRLVFALQQQIQNQESYTLYGDAADQANWDGIEDPIVGYTNEGSWNGGQPSNLDAVNGTITIPSAGVYRITAFVSGNQGNLAFNEAMWLLFNDGVGGQVVVDVFDVSSNKTSGRVFFGQLFLPFQGGEVTFLSTLASADMGTFDYQAVQFTIERIRDL